MRVLALALVVCAGAASSAPDAPTRPVERSASNMAGSNPVTSIRPSERPKSLVNEPATRVREATVARLEQSLRPKLRSQKIRRVARERARMRKAGAVCGDIEIQGETIGRVSGRITGCGVSDAVRIRSVSGIRLSNTAIMDCKTAKALKTWVDDTAKPVLKRKGGGLKTLRVAAHYVCRTRNSMPGARISEHGKGRAIDISGVQLQDGSTITVLKGWRAASSSKVMRALHKGACGPFGTVLGPDGDRFHQDHFHFDTARHRSGTYCR